MLLKSRELRATNPLAMRTYPEEVNLGLLVSKHLRPISLTPILSKLGEDFVVDRHVKPAVLSKVDPRIKFGTVPDSSTSEALVSIA